MPLAFDFTSTLVMGVTFPVATTLLARSPFSTLASFEESILVPPRVAANTPPAITSTTTVTIAPQIISFRRFFLLFPLPFTPPPVDTAKWRLGAIPPPSLCCTEPDLLLFLQLAYKPENVPLRKRFWEGHGFSRAAQAHRRSGL